jgi:tricarballylate dehydrogenase
MRRGRPGQASGEAAIPAGPALAGVQHAHWDVVVAGGGNAALVAALAARDAGASVLLLERAPPHMRGGNTRHTRNVRCAHDSADEYNTGAYPEEELWRDLCGVGEGPGSERLARFTVRDSATVPGWMSAHGVRWQRPLAGTLHLGRTNRFFLGGGKALVNNYYRMADRSKVRTICDAPVTEIEVSGDRCQAVIAEAAGQRYRIAASAVVCASGGFEANIGWLKRYWGDAADNYVIRGTPYNDGAVLAELYAAGAKPAGQEKGFHAVAVDARAPRFDGGIATRLDSIPFGIVVNDRGERFADEGADLWPKRYASWGRQVAEQPGQRAYSLWDSKSQGLFLPPMYGVTSAASVDDLARSLGLDPAAVCRTVAEYNQAVVPGSFDPGGLDDCRTEGLVPPKSHWARRLDDPPFYGIAMRPGITFTYLGVAVDQTGRVVRRDGSRFGNLLAAGEIMSGNILTTGYLAGFGLTIGAVWGRLAGTQAAAEAASAS